MKNTNRWIIGALLAFAVSMALPGLSQAQTANPTTAVAPRAMTRDQAIKLVIEQVAQPSKAPRGLRVHLFPDLLPKGSEIVPFDLWTTGKREFFVCEGDTWFFWLDDDPQAQFGHQTRYVMVDALSGRMAVKESEWWPVVRSKVVWGTTLERSDSKTVVFEKPSPLPPVRAGKHTFKPGKPQALPGCEAWIVLVCGSDDVGNTFDEDVRFMYQVFTGLGYTDDHIFYISPWTTDPGVDRTTTIANVQWAIDQVALNSDAEDKVFFFYSSHGGVDFLQCRPGSPGGGNVTSTDLANWLGTITCRQLTILLQGCHTGSFIGYYADGHTVAAENELTGHGETNRIAITATDTDNSSYGGPAAWGSTFTGGYVDSFGDPVADVDTSGAISVGEAYDWALSHDTAAAAGWSFPHLSTVALHPEQVFHVCPSVDAWISDGPGDVGNNSYDYDSTDIWSSLAPAGMVHENPVSGLTNHVHVRTHNLGSVAVNNVSVRLYWADSSTALAWPADFHQIGLTQVIPAITPGGQVDHTWDWYVDPTIGVGHHFCFVATADCAADPMAGGPPGYTYVAPFDNNIGQKNITIVNAQAGQQAQLQFVIKNIMRKPVPFDLVIHRAGFREGRLSVFLPADLTKILMTRSASLEGLKFGEREREGPPPLIVTAEDKAIIRGIELKPMEGRSVLLKITVPRKSEIGKTFAFKVEQVVGAAVIGSNTFVVRVVSPGDCRTTLSRAAEVFARIAWQFESESADRLVRQIGGFLAQGSCDDRKATLALVRAAHGLESAMEREIGSQVPADQLRSYISALKGLEQALQSGDLEKALIAQASVVDVASRFTKATK